MRLIVRRWSQAVAASVVFRVSGRAVCKYGASEEAFQHLRGANPVMGEANNQRACRGARTLRPGRTSVGNEGMWRFKPGWGGKEQKSNTSNMICAEEYLVFVTGTDGVGGWQNRMFRALPFVVSRKRGAVLCQHWARGDEISPKS